MSFGLMPGDIISNKELVKIFKCSNTGGMRRSHRTNSLVIVADHTKSIYEDKWIGDELHYTGMGTSGDQELYFAQNRTLVESHSNTVNIYLFEVSTINEYAFHGKVELASEPYQEEQDDINGKKRLVWIFPLKIIK